MKLLIIILLLIPSLSFADFMYTYTVGDIVSPTTFSGSTYSCIDCSPSHRYVVTGLNTSIYLTYTFNSPTDFFSNFRPVYKTVFESRDVIRAFGFWSPAPSTWPATNFNYFAVQYTVMPIEKLVSDPLCYTINPSLAVAYATQSNGVITQTVSFLIGALTSIAFVFAVRKF